MVGVASWADGKWRPTTWYWWYLCTPCERHPRIRRRVARCDGRCPRAAEPIAPAHGMRSQDTRLVVDLRHGDRRTTYYSAAEEGLLARHAAQERALDSVCAAGDERPASLSGALPRQACEPALAPGIAPRTSPTDAHARPGRTASTWPTTLRASSAQRRIASTALSTSRLGEWMPGAPAQCPLRRPQRRRALAWRHRSSSPRPDPTERPRRARSLPAPAEPAGMATAARVFTTGRPSAPPSCCTTCT